MPGRLVRGRSSSIPGGGSEVRTAGRIRNDLPRPSRLIDQQIENRLRQMGSIEIICLASFSALDQPRKIRRRLRSEGRAAQQQGLRIGKQDGLLKPFNPMGLSSFTQEDDKIQIRLMARDRE